MNKCLKIKLFKIESIILFHCTKKPTLSACFVVGIIGCAIQINLYIIVFLTNQSLSTPNYIPGPGVGCEPETSGVG